ncbi:hypothetical protein RHCRD62_20681 [Rhodococcus sp. RD6.2]|nr:hypothetical protein RHCRD62_20681 [Rhodococcus sp. RD6.2]
MNRDYISANAHAWVGAGGDAV